MLVTQFLLKNPGLLKQGSDGIKGAEVLKVMMRERLHA
jgi:hypothetical protein